MTDQKTTKQNPLWKLGLAITLPWILLSGPLAGYIVGEWILVRLCGMSSSVTVILMVLGLMGSGFQAYRLIKKLKDTQPS